MGIVGVKARMIPASWLFVAVLVVAVCGPLTAQAGGATLTLREILRIDGEREDFMRLALRRRAIRGVLAVRFHQDGVIRLFRSDGSALATVGRAGAGPGEFKAVNRIGWVGDTLWVSDPSLHRLTMVGADGKVLRSQPLPSSIKPTNDGADAQPFYTPTLLAVLADGSFIVSANRQAPAREGVPSGTRTIEYWVLRMKSDGRFDRVISPIPLDGCTIRSPSAEAVLPVCARTMTVALSGSGRVTFLVMHSSGPRETSFQLLSVDARGDTVLNKGQRVTPDPVSSTMADSILRRYDEAPASVRDLIKAVGIPKVKPPIRGILIGSDGTMWVQLAKATNAGYEWRKYDSKGSLLGTAWIAESIGVVVVEPRGLWAIVANADGVESLVLYAAGR